MKHFIQMLFSTTFSFGVIIFFFTIEQNMLQVSQNMSEFSTAESLGRMGTSSGRSDFQDRQGGEA